MFEPVHLAFPQPLFVRTQVVSITIPLGLLLVFCMQEDRLISWVGLFRLLVVIAPPLVLVWVLTSGFSLPDQIVSSKAKNEFGFWRLSALGITAAVGYGAFVGWVRDQYMRGFHIAVLIALVPLFFGLNDVSRADLGLEYPGAMNAVTFGSVGLVLLAAMFRIYWLKVYIDELTNIPNRRALDEQLRLLGKTFTIAMIDIDNFKKFNDTYGHEQGDHVLKLVAKHLETESNSRVYRYGGEEFCLLFRGVQSKHVFLVANRARKKLAERDFYIRSSDANRKATGKKFRGKKVRGKRVRVTISIGLANSSERLRKPGDVIQKADLALFKAKEKGRNCVVVA